MRPAETTNWWPIRWNGRRREKTWNQKDWIYHQRRRRWKRDFRPRAWPDWGFVLRRRWNAKEAERNRRARHGWIFVCFRLLSKLIFELNNYRTGKLNNLDSAISKFLEIHLGKPPLARSRWSSRRRALPISSQFLIVPVGLSTGTSLLPSWQTAINRFILTGTTVSVTVVTQLFKNCVINLYVQIYLVFSRSTFLRKIEFLNHHSDYEVAKIAHVAWDESYKKVSRVVSQRWTLE